MKIKKSILLALALTTTLGFINVRADPCSATLCMFGMVMGADDNGTCSAAIGEFFAIRIYTPYFNPPATAAARQAFLSGCSSGVESQIDLIISTFGQTE